MSFRGPKRGRNCYITPALPGVHNAKIGVKIRSGYLTPAFSGAQKRAEVLHNPCIPGVPNDKDKIRIHCLTPPFSQTQKRAKSRRHPCIPWGPQRQARGENKKWLPQPYLLRGTKEGGIANCRVHLEGP